MKIKITLPLLTAAVFISLFSLTNQAKAIGLTDSSGNFIGYTSNYNLNATCSTPSESTNQCGASCTASDSYPVGVYDYGPYKCAVFGGNATSIFYSPDDEGEMRKNGSTLCSYYGCSCNCQATAANNCASDSLNHGCNVTEYFGPGDTLSVYAQNDCLATGYGTFGGGSASVTLNDAQTCCVAGYTPTAQGVCSPDIPKVYCTDLNGTQRDPGYVESNGDTSTCGKATRTCQDDGSWTEWVYPGSSTSCNDNNSCTTGDHCDGTGKCVGTNTPINGSLSSWSTCNNVCGSGTQTRTCAGASCGGDATCGGVALSQACTSYSGCTYSWQTGAWGPCNAACGNGTQTRTVTCLRSDGTTVTDTYCPSGSKPISSQTCTGSPCTCSSDADCNDYNSCTSDTCVNPGTSSAYCTSDLIAGTHRECYNNACTYVANTISACSNSCLDNSECVTCTALTYRPATSGFSTSTTGPTVQNITVSTGQDFYAYVDYGQMTSAIYPAYTTGYSCVWDSSSGWINGTVARFHCPNTASSPAASGTYYTGTVNESTQNICANTATMGTVIVSAPPSTTDGASCVQITTDKSSYNPGETINATVTMQNTGSNVWDSSYSLVTPNSSWWGVGSVPLPSITLSYRYLKVNTPSSNSWVAWREIQSYDASGNLLAPATCSGAGCTNVYDGNVSTVSNSGGFSGTIILDYGHTVTVKQLKFLPENSPSPATATHYIYGSNDKVTWSAITTLNPPIYSNQWLQYSPASVAKGSQVTFTVAAKANTSGSNVPFIWQMAKNSTAFANACVANLNITLPPPVISLNPTSFSFGGIVGQAAPAAQSLTITNTGGSTLNWTATPNQSWCHIGSTSGSLAANASTTLAVSVDAPSNALAGTNNCTVTVSDTGGIAAAKTAAVTYTVEMPSSPPGSVGVTPGSTCNTIKLTWQDPASGPTPTAYRIYRSQNNVTFVNDLPDISYHSSTYYNSGTYTFVDSNPLGTYNYYYLVSLKGTVQSDKSPVVQAGTTSCQANLVSSTKQVTAYGNTSVSVPNTCGGVAGNPTAGFKSFPPSSVQLKPGDKVSFAIYLCNTSGTMDAPIITITDTMKYLAKPDTGWNLRYDYGTGTATAVPTSNYTVSTDASGNMVLTFTGLHPVLMGTVGALTFDAVITNGGSQNSYLRFQNTADINYTVTTGDDTTMTVATPPILFYNGESTPNRQEVAP